MAFEEKLENASRIISDFDIVVDGSDNFTTRYLVNDTCVALGKTVVYGSILGFEGQLAILITKKQNFT
jgi:adenylyltransferase/sulfurtransferase